MTPSSIPGRRVRARWAFIVPAIALVPAVMLVVARTCFLEAADMPNRLAREQSPYLQQHASNPVNWYPWGEEALARARAENLPIFLSVGYSTCHWCHVMERESFEREDVAALLNAGFVPIKVDREERPDVDDLYMKATQLMTGHGGWPNSVWLTPDGRPWFAGTYFPREDSYGRPGFKTLLTRLSEVWTTRRNDVEEQATKLAAAIREAGAPLDSSGVSRVPDRDIVTVEIRELERSFDPLQGGFGGAPRFPPHGALAVLLYEYPRSEYTQPRVDSLRTMTTRTLDAMARGGIHDHVGGGFHRYSTDARWFLPHFEKMLYDNAQLGRAYTDAFTQTGSDLYRRTARSLYDWVLRDMTGESGGFYSALDADSEGEEGKFYLWTRAEIIEVLGEEEGAFFARIHDVTEGGNYAEEATGERTGGNILYWPRSRADLAAREGIEESALADRLDRDRARLRERRAGRVWPHLDDKVLASWNGLMIGSLAHAGLALGEPQYLAAAGRAADFVLAEMFRGGRLYRSWRSGEAHVPGYLDDYAFLADGLLDLYEATGEAPRLARARELVEVVLRHFRDPAAGGFFFSSDEHEVLLGRDKDIYDEAIPSGNGIAARVLVRLASVTGEERYREEAERTLAGLGASIERLPRGAESLVHATALYHDLGPRLIASAGGVGLAVGAASAKGDSAKVDSAKADSSVARDHKGPVHAALHVPDLTARSGGAVEFTVVIAVDPGWHINSNKPLEDYLIPTELTVADTTGARLEKLNYPRGEKRSFAFSDEPMSVYEGEVRIRGKLVIPKGAVAGTFETTLMLQAQPCNDESCIAPEELVLPIRVEVTSG